MDGIDRLCARLERRHRIARACRSVLPLAAASGLAGATALAVVRLAVPDAGWLAPAIAATALLAPLAALPRALAVRLPRWRLAGEADSLARADGLLMALAATPDPAWAARVEPRLAAVVLPRLRLPGLAAALAAGALLAGAWLLPQITAPPPAPPVADGALRSAEDGLERIRKQELAAPEAVEAFSERLAAVREALSERGLDQQTWAALDALERDLDGARAKASDRLADALAKAEALAGLGAEGDMAAAAAADLAAAMAELQQQAPGLAAGLPAGPEREALLRLAQQAMAGGALTEEQRQALQRLGLDPAKAQAGGGAQPGDAAAAQRLADRLAGQLAQAAGMAGMAGAEDGQQGPGGPGPGGGHANLDWRTVQRVESGFRDRLAGGTPVNPESGAALGTQARAPREDEQGAAAGATAPLRQHAAAAAGNRAADVAPRHRAAVAGYFSAGATP